MSSRFEDDPEFNQPVSKPRPARGSCLITSLVALAILAFMIALLSPLNRGGSRTAAFRAMCTNDLKQISLALHNYEAVYGALPPAYSVDANGQPLHSWRTLILPYLERDALYRTIDLTKPWNDPANAAALATAVPTYRCPSASGPPNATTYLAIIAPDGCFLPDKPRRLAEIVDDHKATLMVIEAGDENAVPWMAPVDANQSLVMSLGPKTRLHHPGGFNAGFVDGSVQFLKVGTPPNVRRALMTIYGNDVADADLW